LLYAGDVPGRGLLPAFDFFLQSVAGRREEMTVAFGISGALIWACLGWDTVAYPLFPLRILSRRFLPSCDVSNDAMFCIPVTHGGATSALRYLVFLLFNAGKGGMWLCWQYLEMWQICMCGLLLLIM
jgi:hypothetical protein